MADKARSKRRHGAAGAADSPDDVSEPLAPGLYLLSTPIGAADDITIRGLEALRRADILACEDTRVLRRLMDLHGVPVGGRPMIAYHDHSSEDVRRRLLEDAATASVVYASDAGTPLIADPGYRLVVEARSRNLDVVALPGPSAVLAALTVSGLPTDRFCFGGFPPPKKSARQKWLREWSAAPGVLIFYESPRRLAETLEDVVDVLGDREAVVARELTKKFEETRRDSASALASAYRKEGPPKGEAVVLLAPSKSPAPPQEEDIEAALRLALKEMSVKDAARSVADQLSIPRKIVYHSALRIAEEDAP